MNLSKLTNVDWNELKWTELDQVYQNGTKWAKWTQVENRDFKSQVQCKKVCAIVCALVTTW